MQDNGYSDHMIISVCPADREHGAQNVTSVHRNGLETIHVLGCGCQVTYPPRKRPAAQAG